LAISKVETAGIVGDSGKRRFHRGWLVVAPVLLFALADLALQIALSDGYLFGERIAPFDPPLFNEGHWDALERMRDGRASGAPPRVAFDRELGWSPTPSSRHGDYEYDSGGARRAAREEAQGGHSRVLAVIGDSFTHGDEVGGDATWAAILDGERGDWAVKNYGVSAYGIDQALLRYRRDVAAIEAEEVWLGIVPAALLRVASLYRPVLFHTDPSMIFKPGFRLGEDDRLVAIDNPIDKVEDAPRVLLDQEEFLRRVAPGEWFVQRYPAAYASEGSHWSHWSATARLLLTRLEGRGRWPAEHLLDGGSYLSRLVRSIVLTLRGEVEGQGRRFRLLILPDGRSLRLRGKYGRYWEALCVELRGKGVEVIDLTDALDEAGVSHDDRYWRPQGHYAPATNAIVARHLSGKLPR